jgi:hypothetical protein
VNGQEETHAQSGTHGNRSHQVADWEPLYQEAQEGFASQRKKGEEGEKMNKLVRPIYRWMR